LHPALSVPPGFTMFNASQRSRSHLCRVVAASTRALMSVRTKRGFPEWQSSVCQCRPSQTISSQGNLKSRNVAHDNQKALSLSSVGIGGKRASLCLPWERRSWAADANQPRLTTKTEAFAAGHHCVWNLRRFTVTTSVGVCT